MGTKKQSCIRIQSKNMDDLHDTERRMHPGGGVRKVGDDDTGEEPMRGTVSVQSMNRQLSERKDRKNPMVDGGTEDRRRMLQVMRMWSDCSSL